MAAPSVDVHDLFRASIVSVFKGWTGLQLAVQNGCGGPHAMEKADWLVEAVFNWFMENAGIHPEELEEFIADILNAEFDTIAEDGSILMISQRICLDFDCCKSGNTDAVLERIRTATEANLQNSVQVQTEDSNEDMEEDAGGAAVRDDGMEAMLGNVSNETSEMDLQQEDGARAGTSQQDDTAPQDSEGWTVVSKNRKR